MIDINELRLIVQDCRLAGSPVFIQATDMDEILDRLEAAEKECVALRVKIEAMEQQEPVGTLHDDGYFVWRERQHPHQGNYAGWKMALYALPGAAAPEAKT